MWRGIDSAIEPILLCTVVMYQLALLPFYTQTQHTNKWWSDILDKISLSDFLFSMSCFLKYIHIYSFRLIRCVFTDVVSVSVKMEDELHLNESPSITGVTGLHNIIRMNLKLHKCDGYSVILREVTRQQRRLVKGRASVSSIVLSGLLTNCKGDGDFGFHCV